jgi:hypothetical protein
MNGPCKTFNFYVSRNPRRSQPLEHFCLIVKASEIHKPSCRTILGIDCALIWVESVELICKHTINKNIFTFVLHLQEVHLLKLFVKMCLHMI